MSVSRPVAGVGCLFVEHLLHGVELGVLPLHHLVVHLGDSYNNHRIDLTEVTDSLAVD